MKLNLRAAMSYIKGVNIYALELNKRRKCLTSVNVY